MIPSGPIMLVILPDPMDDKWDEVGVTLATIHPEKLSPHTQMSLLSSMIPSECLVLIPNVLILL